MKKQLLMAAFGAIAGFAMLPSNVHALEVYSLQGNECAGQNGFSNCTFQGRKGNVTPTIIKFNSLLNGVDDKNSVFFPTISGGEFSFSNFAFKGSEIISGNWFYTPGDGDPGITAVIAFGGGVSNVFDYLGVAQTSGTFSTASNQGGKQAGLSHLTFFDTALPPTVIPTPAAVLPGLMGMGAAVFRKKKQGEQEPQEA